MDSQRSYDARLAVQPRCEWCSKRFDSGCTVADLPAAGGDASAAWVLCLRMKVIPVALAKYLWVHAGLPKRQQQESLMLLAGVF